MSRPLFVVMMLMISWGVFGQIGGLQTFDFLNLTQSARQSALGGHPVALIDNDINSAFSNPASLNPEMHHKLAINHNFHFTDISYGFTAYGLHLKKSNTTVFVGASYLSYGSFQRANEVGERNGTFTGKENAFVLGASRKLDERIRYGINMKFISSRLESYSSSGIGMDMSITYSGNQNQTVWTFVIKNLGIQLDKYYSNREKFPLDILIGYSNKLEHLPFRFFITARRLNRWNLRNDLEAQTDPIFINENNNTPGSFAKGVENLFRHFTFGGELVIGSNEVFKLRAGYDHNRKKDLSVSGFRSFSGLSFGFGLKIKKLQFDYGAGRYHLAGSVNHLSLILDLDSLFTNL